MGVTNRASQRIGSIRLWIARQLQQALDHVLHLFLRRFAVTNYGLLHLQSGVFGYG